MCVNRAKTCLSSTHSQHVRTGEQRHLLTCSWYPAAAGKLPIAEIAARSCTILIFAVQCVYRPICL